MNNTEVKDIIKARRIQLGLSYSDLESYVELIRQRHGNGS